MDRGVDAPPADLSTVRLNNRVRGAVQTALGAARMAAEGGEDAATLRQRVTSPGGTTQAAIEALEAGGFRRLVADAVARATARGAELSRQFGD